MIFDMNEIRVVDTSFGMVYEPLLIMSKVLINLHLPITLYRYSFYI